MVYLHVQACSTFLRFFEQVRKYVCKHYIDDGVIKLGDFGIPTKSSIKES